MECIYPNVKGVSSYRCGCRCNRCVVEMKEASQRYNKTHKDQRANYRQINKEKNKLYAKNRKIRLKIETFTAYGGTICKCCKEENINFLTLDHVFNDGYLTRPLINGKRLYTESYQKLKNLNFPKKERYQVLCMNCNFGKRMNNGECPHEKFTKN